MGRLMWRIRELRDRARSNLPSTRYLYDSVDFEDPEIRALKLELRRQHRSGLAGLCLFIAVATAIAHPARLRHALPAVPAAGAEGIGCSAALASSGAA